MTVSTYEPLSAETVIQRFPVTASEPVVNARSSDRNSSSTLVTSVLVVALGGFAVAIAYALNRASVPGATAVYWVGQALIVLPVALRVLSPSTDTGERMALLLAMATVQSLLAWCYSPDQFRFPDELQHVRTAADILRTHHLFQPNSYLAVSPGFPGMEEVTSAIVLLTGLSLFHAGLVTASVAHMALPICVFLLYREMTKDDRVAAVATLIYSTAPHYGYFNTLFVYGAVALPFLVLTVRAAVRSYQRDKSVAWIALPFVPMTLTHHLTAFAGVALLVAVTAVVGLSRGGRPIALRLAGATLVLALLMIAWVADRSPSTFSYLASPFHGILSGIIHPGSSGSSHQLGAPLHGVLSGITDPAGPGNAHPLANLAPQWESRVAIVAAGITAVCVMCGIGLVWRRPKASHFIRLMTLLGLAYPALLVVRIVAPGGPELATRALTYGMLLAGVPAAVALTRLWPARRYGPRAAIATALVATLAVSSIVTGLPASWERLPGRFHVAAFESGVDRHVATAGSWAREHWPPNERTACDFSTCSVFAGYARATVSYAASPAYYATTRAEFDQQLSVLTSAYVAVDRRWTRETPLTGRYFLRDILEGTHTRPLAASILMKFDRNPLIDRVYDSGAIQLFDTRNVWGG